MQRRLNCVAHASAEIVNEFLAVGGRDDLPVRMLAEVEGWEIDRREQRFARSWRTRNHQPFDVSTFDRLQLRSDQLEEWRELERWKIREREAAEI